MAEDWLADVRKYAADADEAVVAAIVRYCGIALRTRDASLVSFSDKKETDRVRENYCKKKLALTDDDATLDGAIAAVGARMKADRTKNRVTVYYLLADHFGKLGLFSGAAPKAPRKAAAPKAGAAAAAVAGGAAALAAAPAAAAPEPLLAAAPAPVAPTPSVAAAPVAGAATGGRLPVTIERSSFIGAGAVAALVAIGAVGLAMVGGTLATGKLTRNPPGVVDLGPPDFSTNTSGMDPTAPPAPAAAAPAPQGAAVVAAERDAKPMLTVYFDTGKAATTPDFAAVSQPLRDYLAAHPGATVAISGFNDPSGNAAANAVLSKKRAQAVQAALVAAGVEATRTALVKPADATTTDLTPAQARRVEVTVTGG